MAIIQDIDIRLMLWRLRPSSAYHWRGSGDFGNTMDAIGEWRDPGTQPPTEAELLAEWDAYVIEKAALDAAQVTAEADLADVREAQIQAALDSIDADLTTLAGTPTNAVVVQIIGRILQRQKRIIKALRHLV